MRNNKGRDAQNGNPEEPLLQGLSNENQALFRALILYINENVEAKIDSGMQEMNDSLQRLHTQIENVDLKGKTSQTSGKSDQQKGAEKLPQAVTAISSSNVVVETPQTPSDQPVRYQSTPSGAAPAGGALDDLEKEAAKAQLAREDDIMNKLKKDMQAAEQLRDEQNEDIGIIRSYSAFVNDMTIQKKDTVLDCIIAIIILVNAIVIGISMDVKSPAITVINIMFTCCFLLELAIKFYLHGVISHFSHCSNWFDFAIIAFDVLQLVLEEIAGSDALADAPAASMFRVARLVRLVRLIRLARLNMLDDLVALISGMVGGMTTLAWSVFLFFLILYITALLFREFFGRGEFLFEWNDESLVQYFDSVPRCMLTVFRFFFGDFSTTSGLSMFEGVKSAHGSFAAVMVCIWFFGITIGLFNVIAAIFVESTLAAANNQTVTRKTERMNDTKLWSTRVTQLVRLIFQYNGKEVPDDFSAVLMDDEWRGNEIPEAVFNQFVRDEKAIKALNDLEIEEADHKYLFDILDNDNTGSIKIHQLSDGLERLRGDTRRSDVICVDLMVRSIQSQTDFLVEAARTNIKSSTGNRKKMEENRAALKRIEELLNVIKEKLCGFEGVVSSV